MSVTSKINDQLKIIELTISGLLTYELFRELTGLLIECIKKTGYRLVIIDGSQAISSNIDITTIEKIATESSVLNKYIEHGKYAIVTSSVVDFGLTRIWQSMAEEDLNFDAAIFKTEAEAKLWLMNIQVN